MIEWNTVKLGRIKENRRKRKREGGRGGEGMGGGQRVTGCAVCRCYGKMFPI